VTKNHKNFTIERSLKIGDWSIMVPGTPRQRSCTRGKSALSLCPAESAPIYPDGFLDRLLCPTYDPSLERVDLIDFLGIYPDVYGVYKKLRPPYSPVEEAHESRLAARAPGDVWAVYEEGTGLPRVYVVLLKPDLAYICNERPARWTVAFLRRNLVGERAIGGIGWWWCNMDLCRFARSSMHSACVRRHVGYLSDENFSHPASMAYHGNNCAKALYCPIVQTCREVLSRNVEPRYQFISVIEPKVGQVWTTFDLGKRSSDTRLRCRKQIQDHKHVRELGVDEKRSKFAAPIHVVLVLSVDFGDERQQVHDYTCEKNNTPDFSRHMLENTVCRMKNAVYTVEVLHPSHVSDSLAKYFSSGYTSDGCNAEMFDFQVMAHENIEHVTDEDQAELDIGYIAEAAQGSRRWFNLDNLALSNETLVSKFPPIPERSLHSMLDTDGKPLSEIENELRLRPSHDEGQVLSMEVPGAGISKGTPIESLESSTRRDVQLDHDPRGLKKRKPPYPICCRCYETEWHYSAKTPGEPVNGAPVLVRCSRTNCLSLWHIQCICPEAMPGDTFDFRSDEWVCERCRSWEPGESPLKALQLSELPSKQLAAIEEIIATWHVPGIGNVLKARFRARRVTKQWKLKRTWCESSKRIVMHIHSKYIESPKFSWISGDFLDFLPDSVLANCLRSTIGINMIECSAGGLREVAPSGLQCIDSQHLFQGENGVARSITKRVYRFRSNGQYFGITQYLDVFNEAELEAMENKIQRKLKVDKYLTLKKAKVATSDINLDEKDEFCKCPAHVHISANMKRLKIFYGFRYEYNKYHPKLSPGVSHVPQTSKDAETPKLFADAPPIPAWLMKVCKRAVDVEAIPDLDFVDIVVVNMYAEPGQGLAVHIDPSSLFKRPIVSMRFFGEGILSFNVKAQYVGHRTQSVHVPRGALTVMEGYAADCITHAVRGTDVTERSCSVIMRGCVHAAIADAKYLASLPA